MTNYLVYKNGLKNKPQFRKEPFSTESEAVVRACAVLAAGKDGDFLVEDESGKIITNDIASRNRCKTASTT